MAELTDAIEAAALAMYGTPRLAERNRDMAERAINAAEAIIRADERAKVAEEIREAANREDFEGTSWQAGMAYAHRIALGHAVPTSSENTP